MKKLIIAFLLACSGTNGFSQGAPACPSITPATSTSSICQGQCANLTATVVSNNSSTSYAVSSIPYAPYPYSGGTGISVGTDDVWSPVINLPFAFCYYGTSYTQCVVGSNGEISFDVSNANGYDNYIISCALPCVNDVPANSICGVFRDIDPSLGGNVAWYITGTAPCRALVVYYNNIPLYENGGGLGTCDGTPNSTFQMVLYENTNYIDVYVANSYACTDWNGAYGIIGIQNAAGTTAVCAPGWNYSSTTTGNSIAYRFSPTGAPSYSITWKGPGNVTVGTGLGPINVCPTTTSTYTANMVVTNCNGGSTTYTNAVTVNVTPGPTVNVNSPSICEGNSAALNASGATTYSWSPSAGLSGTTGASVTANPTVTTTYTVTGTSGSCSGTNTSLVTVTPIPTVTVNSPTICSGTSTVLAASGATSYSWTPSSGLSSTTGATVTASPTVATTYTVTGTTGSCQGTMTSTVTILPTPTVGVNSATICSGNSAILTANGATTYSWTPSGGLSATTGSVVTANPGSTTVYTVTGTSGSCATPVTSTVTVNPNPTVIVNSVTLCPGATATLTASGASSYSWSPAGGLSATSGATVTANPGSNTTYTITGTTGSCTNTATSSVTVVASLVVGANNPTICAGQSGMLSATGASSYSWSPAGGLSSTFGATVTANPTVTTTYTVTGSAGSCSATATSTVTVNPVPTVTAAASPASICIGSTATLSAGGASTYSWNTGSGASTLTVSPGSNATYTVVGTDGNGCKDSTTVTVNVTPLPTLTITATPASVCPGQSSTLSGSGATTFTWSANAGGANTPTVSVSPGSATTYTVYGTQSGCANSASVTVTINPAPSLSVSATQTAVCTGGAVTINGSGASNYTWMPGGLAGASVTPTLTTTTTFTMVGSTGAGCVDSTTITVNVNSLPTLTVSPASTSICAGQSDVLSASGASTYTWSANAGSVTTSTASVNPGVNTTYTVTGTDINGCMNTGTVIVGINPTPTVSAGPDQTICAGNSVTLSGGGAVTYTWTGGVSNGAPFTPTTTASYTVTGTDGNGCKNSDVVNVNVNPLPNVNAGADQSTCLGNSVTLSGGGAVTYTWTGGISNGTPFTPTATATYTVTGTDANGCKNSDVVNVIVNPLPNVNAGADQSTCLGNSVTLSGSGAITYTWTGGISNGTPFTPTATASYTVTGTDANGCKNSDVVNVTVNPLPNVNAGANQSTCSGNSVTLSGSGAVTYTWTGGISNGTSFTPTVTANYTVTGTDANGCKNSDVVNVTVNPLPQVNTAGNAVMPCGASSFTLNGSTNAASPSYSWAGPGILSGGNTATPVINNSGVYTLTVTDANGCSNTSTVTVTSKTLSVSFTPDVTSGTSPLTVNFNNTSVNASSYSWTFGNGGTSSAMNPSTTYTAGGTYTVMLVGTGGNCIDTAYSIITVLDNSSVTVPNIFSPNGDGLNDLYFFVTTGIEDLHADLFNRWGELVGTIIGANGSWDGRTLKGENVSDGTYFYILKAKGYDGKTFDMHGFFTLMR